MQRTSLTLLLKPTYKHVDHPLRHSILHFENVMKFAIELF